jgi:hypothetical protein
MEYGSVPVNKFDFMSRNVRAVRLPIESGIVPVIRQLYPISNMRKLDREPIVSGNGPFVFDTLRYVNELRPPIYEAMGLPLPAGWV